MRSVEMIIEFPIEDANLPMPHLLGLANAAFVEEVERQGLLLMSPPSPSVMHARRIVEVRASVVEKPDWAPPSPSAPTFECPNCGTTIFAAREGRGRQVTETMMGVLALEILALVTMYMWREWCTNTREFREMRRHLLQMQEDRQKGETND